MKRACPFVLLATFLLTLPVAANAQRDSGPGQGRGTGTGLGSSPTTLVDRMMKFDANKDGKIAKSEVTDARLSRLFAQADADKDGELTKDEMQTFEAKDREAIGDRGDGPGGPGGPGMGGPGGPGGPGMGGPGGRMAMPRPGEVLPSMARQQLKLTDEQVSQLDELQKDVDARMAKILTDSQKTQLKEMGQRGPGGPGGRGGPGGPGGPGGGRRGNDQGPPPR